VNAFKVPRNPLKILVIAPSWVGDMVLAQSLFKILHLQYENAQIDVLAPKWNCQLLEMMPEVSQSIEMPIGHGELRLKLRIKIANALKKAAYDWAIVLPNSLKSALIPWLANIPKRSGWRGEFRYGLLNDLRKPDLDSYPITVQRYASLAFPPLYKFIKTSERFFLPEPQLHPSEETIQASLRFFGLDSTKPILALCPGAEFGQAKKWPSEYFQQVARQHINKGGQVWLFGSMADRISCEDVAKPFDTPQMKNFAGKTSLDQAVALLSKANQVVANDSGLMHVAAALGRPVVAIYGSTSEDLTPPLSEKSIAVSVEIDCRPCQKKVCPYGHYRCLKELKPDSVIDALAQL
jgi:heptosyltransferase-2